MQVEFERGGRVIRECKIKITSRHIVHNIERFAKYGITPSLFDDKPEISNYDDNTVDPEDFPDEMSDALDEILSFEHNRHGSPEQIIDPYAPDYAEDEDDCDENEAYEDDYSPSPAEMLSKKLDELMQLLSGSNEDDDGDSLIFETAGTIEKCTRDGIEVIELRYTEDESMDGTETVIRFDPRKPRSVTVCHTGGIISTLICDEGVRHITVYRTPVMPFEIAVYTKKCRGFLTPYGGKIELDYMLELRGADLQRTIMVIEAKM